MESFKNWLEIFRRLWKNGDIKALDRILKSLKGSLQNISEADKENVLEELLNKKNGLFKFIEYILNFQNIHKNICNNILKESFNILEYTMKMFQENYRSYVIQTKNICFDCIKSECTFNNKIIAAKTFRKLIKLFNNDDMKLDEIADNCNDEDESYIIYGAIARFHPETKNIIKSIDSIFLKLLYELKHQCSLSKKKQKEENILILLECLSDIMINFNPFKENLNLDYIEKLYKIFLIFLEIKNLKKIRNKIVCIVYNNMNQFSLFIFKDYEKWHNLLNDMCTNKSDEINFPEDSLKIFYKVISSHLLLEYNEEVILYFINYFKIIKNLNLSTEKLCLILFGLGKFAAPCAKYLPVEKTEIFQIIISQIILFSAKNKTVNSYILSNYLLTLSEYLCCMPIISINEFNFIIKISTVIIKEFPNLDTKIKNEVINIIKTVFDNITKLDKNFQSKFFHLFVYENVIWSCSHTLLIDVELQQEINNLQPSVCYKNYLLIWLSLLTKNGENDEIEKQIFQELISVFIIVINRMNLNFKPENVKFFFHTSFLLRAESETDFRYLINFVDFYADIFKEINVSLFQNDLEKFLIYLIRISFKHPMISAFYKLITILLKKVNTSYDCQSFFSKSTCELISEYLLDVFRFVHQFSDELQLSCIYLILNSPLFFSVNIMDEKVTIFKIAFQHGLENFSLAFNALETLEHWNNNSGGQFSNDIYSDFIFCFQLYFKSEKNLESTLKKNLIDYETKTESTIFSDNDKSLETLQKKILLLYGSLKPKTTLDFINERWSNVGSSWIKKNLIFDLLFPEIKLQVNFKNIILSIVEFKNEDRRTRYSICELLHLTITIILGKNLTSQFLNKDLFSTILRFASNTDDAIRNLFHPLAIQLTHYLSKICTTKISQEFVDSLFEGLTNEFNASLRDYCGVCLKEFIQCIMKQKSDNDSIKCSNFNSIVQQIINFAHYPSNSKRLAAAIAFNQLCATLASNILVINTYWLEFLHAFVKSLENCYNIQIIVALNNVENLIKSKANVLNAKSCHRKKLPGFCNETLTSAIIWLFEQCGSVNSHYRYKCIELFESLCLFISNWKSVKGFMDFCGLNKINEIILQNLEQDMECVTFSNIKAFLKSLNFYIWIFNKEYIFPKIIFNIENFQQTKIFFEFFKKFVHIVVHQSMEEITKLTTNTMKENIELVNLMNEATWKVFQFMSSVLLANKNSTDSTDVLENLWTDDLNSLIFRFTLCPTKIGLTSKILQIIEAQELENWFIIAMNKIPEPYLLKIRKNFFNSMEEESTAFIDVTNILNFGKNIENLKYFVRGILILKKSKFFDFGKENDYEFTCAKEKITVIFEAFEAIALNDDLCKRIENYLKDYLEDLMNFFLMEYEPEIMEMLVNFIVNGFSANGSTIKNREFFMKIFKIPIYMFMLKNPTETLMVFDKILLNCPDKMFFIIESLLIFAQNNQSKHSKNLAKEVIKKCGDYKALIQDDKNRKNKFFNINSIAVALLFSKCIKSINSVERNLYSWILEEINNTQDLKEKSIIIESFIFCLVDESNVDNPDLLFIFKNLRNGNSAVWLQNLKVDLVEKSKATQCLQVLLKLLVNTKSLVVYKSIVEYASGVCKVLIDNEETNESLKLYFTTISAINTSKSLEIAYKIFKDLNSSPEERLDALNYFLLPSLESCNTLLIGNFYEKISHELYTFIIENVQELNGIERVQNLVTKIGCYKLFELMFGRAQFSRIKIFILDINEELHLFLMKHIQEARCISTKLIEEKELIRLLHCAALNCCIAITSLVGDTEFYDAIFKEDPLKGQLVWENIIDCDRMYNLNSIPTTFHKKKINIHKIDEALQSTAELKLVSYFQCHEQIKVNVNENANKEDEQQFLCIENDELNNHECSAMITGMIMHFFKSKIIPYLEMVNEVNKDHLPQWLLHFCKALKIEENNIIIYLIRIISNAKKAFVPYLKFLFKNITFAICSYLSKDGLNYLIRDIIVMIIESNYKLKRNSEVEAAQNLVEILIEQSIDPQSSVYEYNIELIDGLVKMWSDKLKIPKNLNVKLSSNPDLSMRIVLMLFRHDVQRDDLILNREVHALVRKSMFRWLNPSSPRVYETLGWIMRCISEEQRNVLIKNDIIDLFTDMERYDNNICVHLFYLTYVGCPCLAMCKELRSFANPEAVQNDELKAKCFEIFLESMTELDNVTILLSLKNMNLIEILRDRVLPCIDIAFKIVGKLVEIFDAKELLSYAEAIEMYTKNNTLLKHKKVAYEIFIEMYKTFILHTYKNEDAKFLIELCKKVLIAGVIDPNDEIQKKILNFWNTQCFPENTVERMLHLLKMFTTEVHSGYTSFLCLLMFELTSKSPDNCKILFMPLEICRYEDYEIVIPRTCPKRRVRAPLFAPSLANELDMSILRQGSAFKNVKLYEMTEELSVIDWDLLERFMRTVSTEIIPNPSESKLSKRSFDDLTIPEEFFVEPYDTSSAVTDYYKKLNEETTEQKNSVRINRRYRIGYYPDVAISQSTVVTVLMDAVRRDNGIADDIVVSLVCSLVNQVKDVELRNKLVETVTETCRRALECPNNFAPVAMKILLESDCILFNANNVTRIAKAVGLQSTGILLLEKDSIRHDEPIYAVQAQKRLNGVVYLLQNRMQLACLYQSIGMYDVVCSIFKNWTLPSDVDYMRQAYLAEADDNWLIAKSAYEEAYESETEFAKDFCLEGIFRCLSQLSSWNEINKKINTILNDDYNTIWQTPKKDDLLPWILTGQLQKTLNDLSMGNTLETNFFENFDDWTINKDFAITKSFGEEMSMFYVCNQQTSETEVSRCLRNYLDSAREQWMQSNCHEKESRLHILMKLGRINDIDMYLRTVKSKNNIAVARELISCWKENIPEIGDDLLNWNIRINYRVALAFMLIEAFKNLSIDSGILFELLLISLNQNLQGGKLAIENKNALVAQKYICRIKKSLDQVASTDLSLYHQELAIIDSRYKFLCGENEHDPIKKCRHYFSSWQLTDPIVKETNADASIKEKAKDHLFDVTSRLVDVVQKNPESIKCFMNDDFILDTLKVNVPEKIEESLLIYNHNLLKTNCEEKNNNNLVKNYMKFAMYCHELLYNKGDRNSTLLEEFTSAVLNAMNLGSSKAILYFSYLLKHSLFKNNEKIAQLFVDKCQTIPSWMFLHWQNQIISYLITPLAPFILPIVQNLVRDYPNAVMCSFREVYEANPQLKSDPVIDSLYKSLFIDIRIEFFFKALEYLCQPEHYLKYHLMKLIQTTNNNKTFVEAIDSLLDKIFANSESKELSLQGKVFKQVLKTHRKDIEKLKTSNNYKICIKKINAILNEAMRLRLRKKKLIDLEEYSPYLRYFTNSEVDIEVPGQYDGKTKPLPQYHAKIMRINSLVKISKYKSNLMKINMIGTNAKIYEFLIKLETEVRQDQRMQQIFKTINEILCEDIKCNKRRLYVNTYNTITLSNSLSLVQWVNATKSMKEFIEFSTGDKTCLQSVAKKYQEWIDEASSSESPYKSYSYKQALLKYNANCVCTKMEEFVSNIDCDLLKKTFMQISPSLDCFIQLRHTFITSYATMCTLHWITGIGDRRLENTLIEVNTGKCFGIDYSLVFGAGIHLPIPELVPFRLSAQVLSFLKPFKDKDLLGVTLSHVLSALKSKKNLISTCVDVFLNESIDWNRQLNEQIQNNSEQNKCIKWSSKIKSTILQKKLNGVKPSHIMLEELSSIYENDEDNEYFTLYKHIVNGSEFHHTTARAIIKNCDLTPDEQVQCLLDQATDPNILGRMWVEWYPFA